MNRYLQYNLTHKQIALVINNYFKFDTATGKLASQREQFCFCTYTYWHYLENLSYQTHAKLWALKSSCEGTFSTKRLNETIVACGALRVKQNLRLCLQTIGRSCKILTCMCDHNIFPVSIYICCITICKHVHHVVYGTAESEKSFRI